MMLDYETLRLIWWLLLGVLIIGFAVMDGFDLGVAALLPVVAKTDSERRVLINTIGPVWEGNQVWFILGGGAIFAAWPPLYATAFSGFYIAMFLVLAALILRPVGFKFRSKVEDARWRTVWDWALFVGGAVPALIFGVAVGNVLQGVPFHFDDNLLPIFGGGFLDLLNPFALMCGLLSLTMVVMHGAAFLLMKTGQPVLERAAGIGQWAATATIGLFALGGLWIAVGIDGFAIAGEAATQAPSNPLRKTVEIVPGGWFANYSAAPWTMAAPALGFVGSLIALAALRGRRGAVAFVGSATAILGIISTVGLSMFPFILPSSTHPGSSITVWDGSSSQLTLFIMLVATAIFMPLVIAYTSWVYRVMRGRVTTDDVEGSHQAY